MTEKKKTKASTKKKVTSKKKETHKTIKVRIFTFKEFLIRMIIVLIVSLAMYFTIFSMSYFEWQFFVTNVNCFSVGLFQTAIIGFGFKLI